MALYQHRFNGVTQLGTRWTNTWWSDSTSSLVAVQAAGEAWASSFYGSIQALLPSGVELLEVVTGEIDQALNRQLAVAAGDVSVVGTGTGNALPTDVAVVVSLRTLLANRRGRGRFYLPPMDSTVVVGPDGRLDVAARLTIVDGLDAAWAAYDASGTPVVYSRVARTTQPISSFDVGDLFDTQRGRQDRILEDRLSRGMP